MIPFAPQMFPNQVTVRKATAAVGTQGGANPVPATGTTYNASVQPRGTRPAERTAGNTSASQSVTDFDIFLAKVAGDTLIPSLAFGDEIDFGSIVLTVKGPAMDRGGYGVLWWIQCEVVQS